MTPSRVPPRATRARCGRRRRARCRLPSSLRRRRSPAPSSSRRPNRATGTSRACRARCPATAARRDVGIGREARTLHPCSCGIRRSQFDRRGRTARRARVAPTAVPGLPSSRDELRPRLRAQRRELLGLLAGRALRPRIGLRVLLRLEEPRVERLASFRIVDDALAHVREPHALDPRRRALEVARLLAVELQVRAAVFDDLLFRRDLAEEIRPADLDAAVAADVQLVARVDAYDPEILDRRFGTVAWTAGDGQLDLVRMPRAPGDTLELDAEPRRVLRAEAAPFFPDTGLHGSQRFPVRMTGHETRGVQVAPDVRQVFFLHAEQVDALTARDLDRRHGVLLGDVRDRAQLLRRRDPPP